MPDNSKVLVVMPGEGQALDIGSSLTVKVPSHSAGNAYTVLEFVLQPGGGAPLHIHQREDEIMYILEGECTFGFAGQIYKAPAGSTIALPKGLPHLFRNEGQDLCRLLITAVPGGLDEYFSEIGTALAQNRPELIPEINLRYEIDFNPPIH